MELILLVIAVAPTLMGFFYRLYQLITESRRTEDGSAFIAAFVGPTSIETAVWQYVHGHIELDELEWMIEQRLRWDDASPLRPSLDEMKEVHY